MADFLVLIGSRAYRGPLAPAGKSAQHQIHISIHVGRVQSPDVPLLLEEGTFQALSWGCASESLPGFAVLLAGFCFGALGTVCLGYTTFNLRL